MEKVIDTIKSFFEENNWGYDFKDEDKVFISGLDMGNILGNVKILIFGR